MKLKTSKNAEINYLAKVIEIKEFTKHPNPKVERLKCCKVDGFNIITGIDSEPGLYIYFPVMSKINSQFLSYNNLFRHKELNVNPDTNPGYFEDNGRVTIIKLQGVVSEGFLINANALQNFIVDNFNLELKLEHGTEFDTIEHEGKEVKLVSKYKVQNAPGSQRTGYDKSTHSAKKFNKIIEGQFRFHYETTIIRKCPWVITPEDIIHISEKVHGTSFISANVLCKTELNWKQKIAKFLTHEEFKKYDNVYSSRKVIKNPTYNPEVNGGYYGCDVYGKANEIIAPKLDKGMTIYGEIVGFTPNGMYIQKNYDYGCVAPSDDSYIYDRNFKLKIYRITLTNIDGIVHEFSTQEVQTWCKEHDLVPITQYYYGKAGDLYPDLIQDTEWSEKFIEKLANDANFNMELNSPTCNNKVPHEGIVIKIENMKSQAFKLKCFAFLNKEQKDLDKGIENIEDNQ